jgi:hypothetical protein
MSWKISKGIEVEDIQKLLSFAALIIEIDVN